MMELPAEFKTLSWFKFLPNTESSLVYAGDAGNGVVKIKVRQGGMNCFYYAAETIYRDESDVWRSTREMLAQGIRLAEMSLFGSFELTLLAAGDLAANRAFDIKNLSIVIVNHARKLQDARQGYFSYAGAWFLIRKLAPLDWGKIKLRTYFQNYTQEREKLDSFIKKMLKAASAGEEPAFLVIRDFSRQSIFRFGEDLQTARLAKLFEKEKTLLKNVSAIYYLNTQTGDQDLLQQFAVSEKSNCCDAAADKPEHP